MLSRIMLVLLPMLGREPLERSQDQVWSLLYISVEGRVSGNCKDDKWVTSVQGSSEAFVFELEVRFK